MSQKLIEEIMLSLGWQKSKNSLFNVEVPGFFKNEERLPYDFNPLENLKDAIILCEELRKNPPTRKDFTDTIAAGLTKNGNLYDERRYWLGIEFPTNNNTEGYWVCWFYTTPPGFDESSDTIGNYVSYGKTLGEAVVKLAQFQLFERI